MNKKFFKVADHVFCVEACDELLSQMSNYAPFEVDVCDACCENPVFSLVVQEAPAPEFTEDTRQEEGVRQKACRYLTFGFWISRRACLFAKRILSMRYCF